MACSMLREPRFVHRLVRLPELLRADDGFSTDAMTDGSPRRIAVPC